MHVKHSTRHNPTWPRCLCHGSAVLAATLAASLVASLASSPALLPAQVRPTTRTITYDEAIRIALQQNAAVRQARNARELGAAGVREARLAFFPDFRLNTQGGQDYGRNFSEAEGQIINETTQSFSAGVSSSVTLFNGFANTGNVQVARVSQQASTSRW